MVTFSNDVWTVPLPVTHTPYAMIQLKRRFKALPDYLVVIVDTVAFMDCYSREQPGFIIPPVNSWPTEKQDGIRQLLDPNDGGIPEMALVSFELASRKKWFGRWGAVTEGVVSFTNGRHRSRYLQYAGAKCFPVETHVSQAEDLLRYCGCVCCN